MTDGLTRVLCVDPYVEFYDNLTNHSLSDYEFVTAANCEEGRKHMDKSDFDVLILDPETPNNEQQKGYGLGFLLELRQDKSTRHLPTVIVTKFDKKVFPWILAGAGLPVDKVVRKESLSALAIHNAIYEALNPGTVGLFAHYLIGPGS